MSQLHLPLHHLPSSVKRLYLACSGGIDSTVLMHILHDYSDQYEIIPWHINHGLQHNAQTMEEFTRQQARILHLEYRVDQLSLDVSSGNIEAVARRQRYRLFEQALTAQDALLTAHHMNDQAETLMLNLMRGSGPAGLSAIAGLKSLGRGYLFRPLLNVTRQQIEHYANQHQLQWIEDPSNADLSFDRNFLRLEVLPVIVQRWPAALQQMHRVSEIQNESDQLQTDLARIDYANISVVRPFTLYKCLQIDALNALSSTRKKNLIRFWIRDNRLRSIGYKKMHELLNQLGCRDDASTALQGVDYQIRCFRRNLYIVPASPDIILQAVYRVPDISELEITAIGFRSSRSQIFQYLKRSDDGQEVSLHFRQGKQTSQRQAHSHRLKRLFHKHSIPPWKRATTPQILIDNELVDLWLNIII